MECTNYQVTRDSGLNGNAGGLTVSNLTDHDNVRILTQNGTKCRGKGKSRFGIYLYLIDTIDIGLDRVLYRDDIYFVGIQLTECRIKSR